MQDEKFGLRFVVAEVQLAHSPKLLERLVDVPYSETLAGVVGHSALALPLQLDLGGDVLVIFLWTAYEKGEEKVKFWWQDWKHLIIIPQTFHFQTWVWLLFHFVDIIHPQLRWFGTNRSWRSTNSIRRSILGPGGLELYIPTSQQLIQMWSLLVLVKIHSIDAKTVTQSMGSNQSCVLGVSRLSESQDVLWVRFYLFIYFIFCMKPQSTRSWSLIGETYSSFWSERPENIWRVNASFLKTWDEAKAGF